MQSSLIDLLRRHAPRSARPLVLLAIVSALCGGGLAVMALVAMQQQGRPTLSVLLPFAVLLAMAAACVGAIVPRAARLGAALARALRAEAISPVLAAGTAEDEIGLAFERLPAPILRGLAAALVAVVAGAAFAAAAAYLLATRRILGAVTVIALLLSVGLQAWRQRSIPAGSRLPHALSRLADARARARFDPASAGAHEQVLWAFAAVDEAAVVQTGSALRARLVELSLASLLVGVALYLGYAGQLHGATFSAAAAQLLIAAPALILLSGRVQELWAGEAAARAWGRLEAQLQAVPAPEPSGELKSLTLRAVRYGARERPLGPLDLDLEGGALVVVQGESGAGKSALLRLLGGLQPALDGRVFLNGSALGAAEAAAALRRRSVSLAGDPLPARLPLPLQDGGGEEATAMLTALRLEPHRFLAEEGLAAVGASSGEAARLALAAGMLDPRPLLLLDDAAIDRDPRLRAAIARDWAPRLKARGKTMVMVTEDADIAAAADRVIRLEPGGASAPADAGRTRQ